MNHMLVCILILSVAALCYGSKSSHRSSSKSSSQFLVIAAGGYTFNKNATGHTLPVHNIEIHHVQAKSENFSPVESGLGSSTPDEWMYYSGSSAFVQGNVLYMAAGWRPAAANMKGRTALTTIPVQDNLVIPRQRFWSYDTQTNKWASFELSPLAQELNTMGFVVAQNKLFSIGGSLPDDQQRAYVLQHDLKTLSENRGGSSLKSPRGMTPFPTQVNPLCVVSINNGKSILAMSLAAVNSGKASLYRSDDAAQSWTELNIPEMAEFTSNSECVALNGDTVFIIASTERRGLALNQRPIGLFNSASNAMKIVGNPEMKKLRSQFRIAAHPSGKSVLACGGGERDGNGNYDASSSCEVYDVQKNTWTVADLKLNSGRVAGGLHVLPSSAGQKSHASTAGSKSGQSFYRSTRH